MDDSMDDSMGPPAFRYARSADGTSLAWVRLGQGPGLVIVPPIPFSNVSGEWSVPLLRRAYRRMAEAFDVVLYDGRGTGASQRSVDDLSTEALVADLVAVLDAAGLERAALLAIYSAVAPAITLAAGQPDRVSHLVVFGSTIDGHASRSRSGTGGLFGLIDEDWALFTRMVAFEWLGWDAGESGELVAGSLRASTTPEVVKAALAGFPDASLRGIVDGVRAETLVLHRRASRQVSLDESAALASALPHGRLHVLEGTSATLFLDDPEGTVDLITSFVRPELAGRRGRPDADAETPLTDREREVLRLIAAGESNAEIAHRLGLSVHTVERHAVNIYRKIDARGRADATAWAVRRGHG